MGGQACQLVVRAKLLYTAVPPDPKELPKFDAQMRDIHAIYDYAQSLVNETSYTGEIVKILEKAPGTWTTADRETLLDGVAAVCGKYT